MTLQLLAGPLGYALVHDLALERIDGAELERQLCYGLEAALRALTEHTRRGSGSNLPGKPDAAD